MIAIIHLLCAHLALQLVQVLEHELVSEVGSVSEPSLFIFLSRLFLDSLLNPDQSTLVMNGVLVGTGFLLLLVFLKVVHIPCLLSYLPTKVFAHKMHLEALPPGLSPQISCLGSVTQRLVRLANTDQFTQGLTVTCFQPEEILCRLGLDFDNWNISNSIITDLHQISNCVACIAMTRYS